MENVSYLRAKKQTVFVDYLENKVEEFEEKYVEFLPVQEIQKLRYKVRSMRDKLLAFQHQTKQNQAESFTPTSNTPAIRTVVKKIFNQFSKWFVQFAKW